MDLKEKIVSTAFEMYLKYGIRSVTMDDLSRELGVSKKTIYKFIDNKKDLVKKAVERQERQHILIHNKIREESENAVEELFKLSLSISELLRNISPTTMYDLNKYYKEIWDKRQASQWEYKWESVSENLKWGKKQKLYRQDLNVDIITHTHVARALSTLEDDRLITSNEFSWVEIFEETFNYHIHGIASPKGLEIWKKYKKEYAEKN